MYAIASKPALKVSPGWGLEEKEAELKKEGRKEQRAEKREGRREW